MMGRILVTPRSLSQGSHSALKPLTDAGFELVTPTPGATPNEAALLAAVPGCVGWLAGVEQVSEAVIVAADSLRVISRNGTGVDNLPLAALSSRNIVLCRAEGTNARGVAELALALTMAGLRSIVFTHEGMRRGDWPRRIGREIAGATIGVVGLGAIGSSFAEMCLSIGAQVRGFDPLAPQDRLRHPAFSRTDLNGAISGVDAISLHAPLAADGGPLLDAVLLGQLAPGIVLVNTARAGLVDEVALLAALTTGHVASYACDVYDTEPPAMSALLAHPNVILTSHIGGFTGASVDRSTQRAVSNLLEMLGLEARHAHAN